MPDTAPGRKRQMSLGAITSVHIDSDGQGSTESVRHFLRCDFAPEPIFGPKNRDFCAFRR